MHPLVRLAVLLPLAACPTSDAATPDDVPGTCARPIPQALTPEPGIQQGFVVDACGAPLDGVRVITRNAFAGATDRPLTARTSAGFYTQRIPPASVWETWAEIDRDFAGARYCLAVFPEDPAPFDASRGAVRDMIWRLDGERPDSTAGNRRYNGGRLVVDANRLARFPGVEDSMLTFIFRRTGPLVDGSTPPDFARRVAFRDLGTYDGPAVNGFPLGKYEVTVAITFPGDPTTYQVYTRINTLAQPFAAAVTATFSDGGKGSGDITCLSTPRLDLELSPTP